MVHFRPLRKTKLRQPSFFKGKYARRVSELPKFTSLFCTKFLCASHCQRAKERAVCQGVSSAPKTPLLLCRVCLYVCTELLSSATFNNSSFTAPREGVFVALRVSIVSSARRKQTEMSFCYSSCCCSGTAWQGGKKAAQ
jgi:hypothetical protein